MDRRFFIWDWTKQVKSSVWLDPIRNFTDSPAFYLGRPFAGTFPKGVQFPISHGHVLTDNLTNVDSLIVVSKRLQSFLERRGVGSVEYLPVSIVDKKDAVRSDEYFIVHTIDDLDCLDVQRSEPSYSSIRKQAISLVKRMVLDPSRVPADRELFQVKEFNGFTFATSELAEAIEKEGFTSVGFQPIEEYDPYA
jgi:hypothetical protein